MKQPSVVNIRQKTKYFTHTKVINYVQVSFRGRGGERNVRKHSTTELTRGFNK